MPVVGVSKTSCFVLPQALNHDESEHFEFQTISPGINQKFLRYQLTQGKAFTIL
jgi:hypothetical protein